MIVGDVFLSSGVCCSMRDFGIPRKHQTGEGSMYLIFCLKLAGKYLANVCGVDSSFGREENEKNLKFFNLFPNSEVV
jgi:hypothetical protein